MLAKWPIKHKLHFCVGLLLVIVGVLSWSGMRGLYTHRALVKTLNRRASELPHATALSRSVSDVRILLADLGASHYSDAADVLVNEPPERLLDDLRGKLDEVAFNLGTYREKLEFNLHEHDQISPHSNELDAVIEMESIVSRVLQSNRQPGWHLRRSQLNSLSEEVDRLHQLASTLPNYLHQDFSGFALEARVQYRALIVLSYVTTGIATVTLTTLVGLIYLWIHRPIRKLVKGCRKVATGQFSYRIELDSHDEMAELAQSMNDMTSRFRTIRDDLDRQVQERTKQVVRNEQLASVGFLAAGVAHEINNPLASIAMCAESLESRLDHQTPAAAQDSELVHKYLQMIQSEAFRCKGITERLLDFSRMGDSLRASTDLRELVDGVIEMIRHLGKYQGKNLVFAGGGPVFVSINGQEIKQVVLNLLTNALESIEPGGIVSVDIRRDAEQAELVVQDNGCGMDPYVLENLFEPFFTRRKNGQGTGLGLSIAYRIVADHDGTIIAQSDGPGRGATFRVKLPLAKETKELKYRYQAA